MCIRDRGTLYPILHGLEKGKYLSGYQQQAPSGRMRKYYRLTRKGRELLAEKKADVYKRQSLSSCPLVQKIWALNALTI